MDVFFLSKYVKNPVHLHPIRVNPLILLDFLGGDRVEMGVDVSGRTESG